MRFEKGDELRTSKLRQSKRYSDHVDTATVFTQSSEETEPKTKKARQEEEDEGVLENCNVLIDWLEEQNELLDKQNGGSPVTNQSIKDEIKAKEAEYNSLRMLAEAVIAEKRESTTSHITRTPLCLTRIRFAFSECSLRRSRKQAERTGSRVEQSSMEHGC